MTKKIIKDEKMDTRNLYDYATPLPRVFLEPNLIMGIGIIPATTILILTIVLMNMISIWCFVIGLVLFFIARILCKNDPPMLSIIFNRIYEPSLWRC